jgi:DnaJ-class molecular chaperone
MKDYYKILGLAKTCSHEEVSNSFRKLALKRRDLESLREIAEAYDVLSNSEKRKNYDLFGEFVFRSGLSQDHESYPGYSFDSKPEEIFLNFFGTSHPYFIENKGKSEEVSSKKPPSDITVEVPCTLEELYSGCRKNVQYTDSAGNYLWKELEIPAGCENSFQVVFFGEGEDNEFFPKSNLVFVVKEVKHKVFRREGKHLFYTARISLLHALSGTSIEVVSDK